MRTHVRFAVAVALVAAVLGTTGCVIRREPIPGSNEQHSSTESVSLESADSASVHIAMGAGELTLSGSQLGSDVLRGTFDYSPSSLEPELDSKMSGDRIDVSVSHPSMRGLTLGGTMRNEWDLLLAEGVPTDLRVSLGAGESDLDLSGLDLTDLRIEVGAGTTTVDLSGPRDNDLSASITAGAGEVTIQLPQDVGVRVSGRADGIGEWEFDGFTSDGNYLVNDAYGTTETTIDLDVQRGIGVVTLELVD